ncbi:MAG: hypothetical protein RSE00_02175 [Clostridia bacterium]
MKKNILLKIGMTFCALSIIMVSRVYSQSSDINVNTSTNTINSVNNTDTQNSKPLNETEIKKQKEEINMMLEECLKELKSSLIEIDSKLAQLKTKDEYNTYPAIRLNIDTPMFGLYSIVDQRLKITKDVSTMDVASGFSIRDVVKGSYLKVPDVYALFIVVKTRDVKLDENISLEDGNIAALKLMQYISQVNNTKDFLDLQINKTFNEYIPKKRTEKIKDLEIRTEKITNSLVDNSNKLNELHIMVKQGDTYDNFLKEYTNKVKEIHQIKQVLKNILITDEQLGEIEKQILTLESKMIDYSKDIEDTYKDSQKNIDEKQMIITVQKELEARRDNIKKYLDGSTSKKEVVKVPEKSSDAGNNKESLVEDGKISNISKDNLNAESNNNTSEEIKLYEVTSAGLLDSMNIAINSIKDLSKTYVSAQNENIQNIDNQESLNKSEVNSVIVTNLTNEEKKHILEQINKIYADFILKENKFYLDNLNFLLKDTTMKISEITKNTGKNVMNEMKYVYLELPLNLERYAKTTDYGSIVDTKILTSDIANELVSLINANISVTKTYKEMVEKNAKT